MQYVTGENFDKVYVDVAGYNFTLEIDENNGFTLGTAFAFAEEVMAEISLKLNENKFALSADVLNYSVEASADKENGTFTVSVYETAQSEDEEATLADKEEIASLTFACVDNMLTLRLSIFGDDYVDFTADSNEGNFNLLIPIDVDEHLLVNLIWTTENNVTTVYLSYEETVLRFVLDLSDKASLAISLGEFNEEEFVATYENIFTADVSLSADEEGTLTGMTVEYTIDARNVDLLVDSWFNTWNGEIIAEYSTFFYLLKDKVEISFNQKITVDETNKDVAKGDIEKFKKLEFEYVDVPYWIAGYCLYYVEEEVDGEVDNYYLLNVTELYGVSYIYVYEMIIDCDENGCPVIPMLRYENYCADWCYLDLQFGGETTVTKYKGCSIEETSIVDKYVDFREFSVDFYYNVKTGETADDIDHTWTVTDVKYRSDSHKCEDGLSVSLECSACGTKVERVSAGCVWLDKESKTITTTCEDMSVRTYYCPGCNDTMVSYWYDEHDTESFETLSLSEEDLKKKYPTAYHISSNTYDTCSYICMLCNLVVEEYTVYTYDVTNGCHEHILYRYLQIDYNSKEITLLYETEEDRHDVHFDNNYYDYYESMVIEEDDEYTAEELAEIQANNAKGQKWLNEINQKIGRSYSLDLISEISYCEEKCDACGYLSYKRYEWDGWLDEAKKANISGSIVIIYDSHGKEEGFYYYCYEPLDDVYAFIEETAKDKLDAIKQHFGTKYTDLSGVSGRVTYYYNSISYNGTRSDITIWFYDYGRYTNVDNIYIDDDTFRWYDYSACLKTKLTFNKDGSVTVNESEKHDYSYQHINLGNNCEKDGWYNVSVCDVCSHKEGSKDDTSYYHYGYQDWGPVETKICENLYVSYRKGTYYCCGAVEYSDNREVYLTGNVVLDKNVYIYGDNINLKLNGYTLDLNGYDFVICSFGGETADVNVYDVGRYVYNEETEGKDYVLGQIVDSKSENEKGMFVICVNGGNIDVGNINISCNSYLSDTDDSTTIVQSVYDDKGYELTLGTRFPEI